MEEVSQAQVSKDGGIAGDRRGAGGPGRLRQVTVLSAEVWQRVCDQLGADLPWTLRRANLLVSGIDLPREAGARLSVGDLDLEVTMETAPCSRMDEQHQGLRTALTDDWRGGVCCRRSERCRDHRRQPGLLGSHIARPSWELLKPS